MLESIGMKCQKTLKKKVLITPLGAGVGIAVGTKYRNCFDEFHILGDNGNYYKTTSNGTTGEFKVFAKYRFPTKNPYPICRFYISAQYSIRTGIGATIGIDI